MHTKGFTLDTVSPSQGRVQSIIYIEMPFKLQLINKWKVKNMYKCEKQLHEKFNDFRVNGEWFKFNNECLIELDNIMSKWD